MRSNALILVAIATLAAVPVQADAAVMLGSVRLQANHDLASAYLLVGDKSAPAASVAVIKLGDYLTGGGKTSISPPALRSAWNSSVFTGALESLAVTPRSTITYAVLGVYDVSAPVWDVTLALPKNVASSAINIKTWNDVFSSSEQDLARALVGGDVQTLQNFFVSAQKNVGFATVGEQAQLVKFCIAHDGGVVDLVTVPEPTAIGLVGVGLLAGLVLRRHRGDRTLVSA